MTEQTTPTAPEGPGPSPFHSGELAIQDRVGFREKVDRYGRRGIRGFMPEEHREFFQQLPLFLVGSVDAAGRPWASALSGPPGFVRASDPTHLRVAGLPAAGDPLGASLTVGAPLGGLGIEFHSRRRNRVNGHVAALDTRGFTLAVDQSFGNCPKYIRARHFRMNRATRAGPAPTPRRLSRLDAAAVQLIGSADTLFIVSAYLGDAEGPWHGVDVSHRGGRPGFVHVLDPRTLVIPDYQGNYFFYTLGNLQANPRCGITFMDFATGDVLQLSGHGEIVWPAADADPAPDGALRWLRVTLEEGVLLCGASSLNWDPLEVAPEFEDA